MVNGGTVRNDSGTVKEKLSKFQNVVTELDSSWKGNSHDNFASKANEFVSEYSAINTQMESFASACDLYEKYKTAKSNYNTAQSAYNNAVANNQSTSTYSSQMSTYQSEMNNLKGQIEQALSAAKTPVLNASGTTASTVTTSANTGVQTSSSASATANKAVDWAISIANDNSYGYISGGMGNGGYDCTQFVHAAYEAAGISLPEKGNVNNANIVDYYTTMGFEWVPGPIDPATLQPGDVLVNKAHHAEMYIGDGKKVGAHDNYDGGGGDSSGDEISVNDYQEYGNGGWDGYLRYTG